MVLANDAGRERKREDVGFGCCYRSLAGEEVDADIDSMRRQRKRIDWETRRAMREWAMGLEDRTSWTFGSLPETMLLRKKILEGSILLDEEDRRREGREKWVVPTGKKDSKLDLLILIHRPLLLFLLLLCLLRLQEEILHIRS